MGGALAPAPRERGWIRIVLALAAFLLLSHAPGVRALMPVVDTGLLLFPALTACFVVGWWAGGSALLAFVWVALAVALFALPARSGSGAYYDIARAWGLLVAGAFGIMCVTEGRRPFIHRVLSALGIAALLALVYVSITGIAPSQAEHIFASEFETRNAATAAALDRWVPAATPLLPTAREWATNKALAVQRASAAIAAPLYPALLALESLAACALAWALYHRLSRARIGPPLVPIRAFAFNDQLIWALVAGVTMSVLPSLAGVAGVGRNLVVFFGALYALRGYGIMTWYLPVHTVPTQLVALLAALVLLPLSLPLALGIGLSDTWVDWRHRLRAPSPPTAA